jgi:hypothetical protein
MPDSKIDFSLDGIGHQLAGRLLQVPLYQRSYAWGEDQVSDFCSDLRNAFNASPREHFMGTIVLSEGDDGRSMIIDGQQRLATAALFIAAIRDYYTIKGEDRRAGSVNTTFLNSYSDREDKDEPRLRLNSEDDEFFAQYIIPGTPRVAMSRDSHPLIQNAYDELMKFIASEALAAGTQWVQRLVDWREFIEKGVRVIYVAVPTESDAFMIFETLNDRGADLTLADLLKNNLFGKAGTAGLDQVRERWLMALSAFDTNQELFITFLRHYWSSKNGATRERDLYKNIKSGVSTAAQAIAFATELEESSVLYAALLSSDSDYWTGWGTSTKANIESLSRLALEQNKPMLLAVLQHFTRAEAKKTLRLAVNWGVRGVIVGGIGGGSTERAYCDAAVAIRNGKVKTAKDLLKELESIVATDDEFEAAFSVARVTKTALARYYLLAIEAFDQKEIEPELVPNSNEEQVNLEHVLPKKATEADWPLFKGDLLKQWVDRIGNHALLSKTPNNQIGSKPFSAKRAILKSSKLTLTSSIGSEADWTPTTIAARQAVLAKKAVSVWKRSL